jgi:hypothetical protein
LQVVRENSLLTEGTTLPRQQGLSAALMMSQWCIRITTRTGKHGIGRRSCSELAARVAPGNSATFGNT